MPDNQFENKVKQKLDELAFSPSGAVWQKVEEQIKKNKRRRLLWIPLLCLLLAGGIWFYLPGKSKPEIANKPAVSLSPLSTPPKNPALISGETTDQEASLKEQEMVKESRHIPSAVSMENTHQHQKTNGITSFKKAVKQTETDQQNQESNGSITVENNQQEVSAEPSGHSHADKDVHKPVIEKNSSKALAINSPEIQTKPASVIKDSLGVSAKKKRTNTRKDRLEWSVTGGAGLSALSMDLPHGSFLYNASSYYGSPSSAPGYFASPYHKPSLSFNLGILLEKPLNKTTRIFSGVRYTYSGIKIKRGYQVNQSLLVLSANNLAQSINSYYAAATASDGSYYTEHYHFIEIPLGIEKRLGSRSRFSLDAGVSVARLISTNALQYNPPSGIYYKDNSYFHKTQVNVLGGMQYQLLRKEKYSLKLGPQLEYGLTNLMNKKSAYSEHLFYGGLQMVLSPNKK